MNSKTYWLAGIAVTAVACSDAFVQSQFTQAQPAQESVEVASTSYNRIQEQRRQEAEARAKDPKWKPEHGEVGSIKVGDGSLRNFCLNAEGNILACYAPSDDTKKPAIRVYSPDGNLRKTLPLEISPESICVNKKGAIFVAGDGRLIKLDANGKTLAAVDSPVASAKVVITEEIEEMLKMREGRPGFDLEEEKERMLTSLKRRRATVPGLAATDRDLFMAVPAPSDFSYQVYRFDHDLKNPKLTVERLRGCCGQMDIQAHDDKLWIAHNARHRVETLDRDGNPVSKFGKKGKVKASDFGGCCEPKNVRVLPNGDILAAESGPPTCIKRFSADGKFLGVVGLIEGDADCLRVTVAQGPDNRYYLLDTNLDSIRILGPEG